MSYTFLRCASPAAESHGVTAVEPYLRECVFFNIYFFLHKVLELARAHC